MAKIIETLKRRWGVTSAWSVILILIAFALAGTSTLHAGRWINQLLGLGPESNWWLRAAVFAVGVLPLYYLFLFVWGSLLGQRRFVTEFIRVKIDLLRGRLFGRKAS